MLFGIVLSLVFGLLRLPSLFEPNWYGDEGIYLTLGQAINHGLTLYSQIHDNKPPTLYYLAALSQTVFGFRLLLFVWMIPTIYVFYRLSLLFLSKNLARLSLLVFLLLTSIPLVEGNIANAEIFMLLPTILAVYLLFSSRLSLLFYLISGLLLGFAFTIKVPVAIEFGFIFLYILFFIPKNKFKNLSVFSLSFIVPTFLYAIYFYFKGAFNQFIFAALLQNFGYLSSWTTGSHSGSATSGGLSIRLLILIITWTILFFLRYKKLISLQTLFLYGWFFACIFGVLLSTRPYPHYLIQLLPPFCLIIVGIYRNRIHLISVFSLLLIILNYKFYFYPVLSYYHNFYFNHNQPSFFGSQVESVTQIANYLKSNTESADRIFVWGDSPFLYPLSDRLPIGKYTVAYHIVDFNGYDLTINQLKTHFPKFIVYYSMTGRSFIQLDNFISKYYRPANYVNSVIIYQRC